MMNPEALEHGMQTPDLNDNARLIVEHIAIDGEDDAFDRLHAVARVEHVGDEWFQHQQAQFAARFLSPSFREG